MAFIPIWYNRPRIIPSPHLTTRCHASVPEGLSLNVFPRRFTSSPGIEPGSAGWKPAILTIRLRWNFTHDRVRTCDVFRHRSSITGSFDHLEYMCWFYRSLEFFPHWRYNKEFTLFPRWMAGCWCSIHWATPMIIISPCRPCGRGNNSLSKAISSSWWLDSNQRSSAHYGNVYLL